MSCFLFSFVRAQSVNLCYNMRVKPRFYEPARRQWAVQQLKV